MSAPEEFVKAWVEAVKKGYNQAYLAEKFGVSRQYISARAQILRKRGVKLPKMKRAPSKYNSNLIDVDSLNELIEKER